MRRLISRRELLAWSLGGAACLAHASRMRADVPWLSQVQQPPAVPRDSSLKLAPLLVDHEGNSISSVEKWKERREELRAWWLKFLGQLPLKRDNPPAFQVLDEEKVGSVLRQHLSYEVEPGEATEAYLLKPLETKRRAPGILAFHSTVPYSILQPAGLAGPPEKHFGLKFAQAGYVTLCPRNYLWPDNDHIDTSASVERFRRRHPECTGMAKMLWDAMRAVDLLASLPEVDSSRIGAVGHSLGAKEVLYLSAFDDRIRVTVSSEGGIGTRFSNWDAPWYLGDAVKQSQFDHEHHELLALSAPRAFLLIGGDSSDGNASWPFVEAALDVYRLFGGTPKLGLFNHRQGHSLPPEAALRIDEWFREYLPV
jgi:dienelactone hydrolase